MVEASLCKENSSSIQLFNLVVRLELVEMKHGVKISVTRVLGKRMQAEGTYDVSSILLRTEVNVGKEMIEYCPWTRIPLDVAL